MAGFFAVDLGCFGTAGRAFVVPGAAAFDFGGAFACFLARSAESYWAGLSMTIPAGGGAL